MEARHNRKIKSGAEFNHLIPKAEVGTTTIHKNASVSDTLAFIPKVVHETQHHTSKLAPLLLGNSVYETCKNIWHFVYEHIAYRKDKEGYEQIRSPARVWHDRFTGVDCDCYTTFISSILTNLQIPHSLRITKYHKPQFQHIYPIVPTGNNKHITIDCVVDRFNYEEPYSQKQDTKMELEYLNGLDGDTETIFSESDTNVDTQDLIGVDEMLLGDLGRKGKPKSHPIVKGKPKILSKVLHVANRANPATTLMRNGVLASMKLNLFGVAQKLKWSYLSDSEANKRGINPQKFEKLKAVRAKLESIYFGAGGKPENLKSAILRGKGNRGHDVSGVNGSGSLNDITDFGYDGIEGLGEPATATAIASASAIMGAIAGLVKSIGNIFPSKNTEGASDFDENTSDKNPISQTIISENKTVSPSITDEGTAHPESNVAPSTNENSNTEIAMRAVSKINDDAKDDETKKDAGDGTNESMWEKNKKWLKPTLIGVGGAGVLYLGYRVLNSSKPPTKSSSKNNSLNGVKRSPPKRKSKRNHSKKKQIIHKKSLF